MEEILNSISDLAAEKQGETYIGEDGLKWCAKHHKPVQVEVEVFGEKKVQNCRCADCREEENNFFSDMAKHRERYERRQRCFGDKSMIDWTFDKDDNARPDITSALQRYADNFAEYRKDGKGLVLYGSVGTGKTFMAACVANKLIDKGYWAYVTDIATLTDQMQESFGARLKVMERLSKYDLLVIDDLGTERDSAYMQEIVFNVIDSRYQAKLPLIVTTNLTADSFKKPKNLGYERIFDRLFERSIFIELSGQSRRRQMFINTQAKLKSELGL